jgi:hypothetical protein
VPPEAWAVEATEWWIDRRGMRKHCRRAAERTAVRAKGLKASMAGCKL